MRSGDVTHPGEARDVEEKGTVEDGIALIGMAGRFPGAASVRALWSNLYAGVESIRFFTPEELAAAGVPPEVADDPSYVPAAGVLDQIEEFDAGFFGFSPREAEILDPQDRLFLECAWEALEDAGYDPSRVDRPVGVYGGEFLDTYLFRNLYANPSYMARTDPLLVRVLNDKDFLTTLVSYKLDLRGPSVAVQTACSTSLVAVHLACEALLSCQCDMALAGGVTVAVPHRVGYRYREGSIFAPDGHCRPFAAAARGTVGGNGAGVVVLKRLAEALEDGDHVYAVVRGSAINNDGSLKAGYTAPSVDGQAEVVAAALAVAGIDPATVTYIEAHGTGTEVGDPIELAALQQVFGAASERKGFCGLGSIKSNLGHLEAAAGVAGLIKTALALERRRLPASLHCGEPNPALEIDETAFCLVTKTRSWETDDTPRRAGVSSFGVGGTNAHVVLEEAPPRPEPKEDRSDQVLTLSAATPTALGTLAARLAAALDGEGDGPDAPPPLADAAFTLQVGRKRLRCRRALVCGDRREAVEALSRLAAEVPQPAAAAGEEGPRPVVFLFPGQGAQHPGMGRELYARENVFRREVDRCVEVLQPVLGLDLREILWPAGEGADEAAEHAATLSSRPALGHPALFLVEWALARLWMTWGIRPTAMLGHSLGEYTAAAVAGVLRPEDALLLVAERGRWMEDVAPPGAMIAVHLPAEEALARARDADASELTVALINAPNLVVLSGPENAVDRLVAHLAADGGVEHRRLHTSHAFHSPALKEVEGPLGRHLAGLSPGTPEIPYLSNLTGGWIGEEEAQDPGYWLRHMTSPVRFTEAMEVVLADPDAVLLEVGPGESLSRLVRQQPGWQPARPVVSSLPHPRRPQPERRHLLTALGRLWEAGVEIDWTGFHGDGGRRRVPLPTYPFERRRYWVEPATLSATLPAGPAIAAGEAEIEEPAREQPEEPAAGKPVVDPAAGRPPGLPPYVAPRDAREAAVAKIFSDVLGVPEVGAEDDFFELGGHSLLATQVVARLRERFGTSLPLADLHETSTVADLAARLAREQAMAGHTGRSEAVSALVADPAAAGEPFPLTDVQEAYWVGRSGAFELGEVATHWYIEVEERGLDLDRFEAAWRRLVERHDALRTVLLADGRQRILQQVPRWHLPVVDLADVDPAAAEHGAEAVRRRMSHQVLDAASWPLFDLRATILEGARVRIHFSLDLLIADAWSFVLLSRELAVLYRDPGAELPPLGVSFRDYVISERALRDGEAYRASLEYWRRRLVDLPRAPELPLARRPEELGRPRFVRRTAEVSRDVWAGLKNRAARRGVTPSGIVVAVLAEVLGAWSKSHRFTLNLTLFNRLPLHPDVNRIVGDFTSLTLLTADVSGGTFEERARRLQGQLWQDLDHRLVSGVEVMRELARISAGARRDLMPVVFTSTLGMESGEDEVDGLPGEVVYSISQTPQVWIDVQVRERGGALRFNWDAVEELFPDGLLDDLFTAFCRLLELLGGEAEAGEENWRWRYFDLLPAEQAERHRRVNATEAPAPRELLHEPFAGRAAEDPDCPAVFAADGEPTYGELDERSRCLAAVLQQRGAKPEELVAVMLPKGWRQVAAVLGISRCGAAWLPVDPTLPAERARWLLERGEVRLAVTAEDAGVAEQAWPPGVERLNLETSPADPPPLTLPCPAEPDDLAYVIFTSGSTGLPKGVMIEHAAAANTLADVNRRFAVGPGDRVLALSSLSFDLSVYDVFGLLAAGGAVVMPADDERREPARWLARMETCGVTVWNSVPALLGMLAEHLEETGGRLPTSLRLVLLSGDWIPVDLPDRVRALSDAPDLEIVSLGGATEVSVWSILHPVGVVDPQWKSIPYGRPMANQRFYVLDLDALTPRPDWVPGQLYIAGAGLARGYWRDPERTRASFLRHPETGERLYATGDLGRWRPEGRIEFLGREDNQVKVGGYRIELGEVEAALVAHPAVAAAAAVAAGEQRGARRLVAYVVAEDDSGGDLAGDLRAFVEAKLPEYMIPAAIVPLDALPLSANGKVDRKLLATREATPVQQEPAAATPRGPLEEAVAGVWAEVLERETVGVHENFFELGGDSVLATRITARLGARLGVEMPLRSLFATPTVAGVAAAVQNRWLKRALETPEDLPASAKRADEPMSRRPATAEAPLSFQQQRMWFLQQLDPDSSIYHLPRALRLAGPLQPSALTDALAQIESRHEALRTRFEAHPEVTGGAVQTVEPFASRSLAMVDLTGLPPADREREAQSLVQLTVEASFDLARGPLFRRRLLRLGGNDHVLILNLHHLISDGWSLGVLGSELEAAYAAFSGGTLPQLPPLPVQYGDFSHWQRRYLDAAWVERELAFWRQYLEGAPQLLELPTDRPRPEVQSFRGSGIAFTLARPAVEALARREGVTLFMLLGSVFAALLARLSERSDLLLGTPVANRPRPELEPLIGLFVNTVMLRARPRPEISMRDFLGAFRDSSLKAFAHQELPFERLVDDLVEERDVQRNPLAQAFFVHQSVIREIDRLGRLKVCKVPFRTGTSMFDLTLTIADTATGIAGWLEYNADLFDATTARRWANTFQRMVAAVTDKPDLAVAALPMLARAERHQLLYEWEGIAEVAEDFILHERFAEVAARRGDAPALTFEGFTLGYTEVAERSARLARHLRKLGVGPEVRVGICLERSAELVIAILGVLTAGGAYVPLDPQAPAERIRYIFDDCGAAVVVSQGTVAERVATDSAQLLRLEDLDDPEEEAEQEESPPVVTSDHTAYVIYTSGSTGLPKGVMVTHGQISRLFTATAPEFGFNEDDVWTLFHSCAFDFSVWEMWGALLYGGRLVVVSHSVSRSPQDYYDLVVTEGVTVLNQTPSAFLQFMRAEETLEAEGKTGDLALRWLILGGEALMLGSLRPWLERHGDRSPRLVNLYGITETAVVVTSRHLSWADLGLAPAVSSIGQALPDLEVYLVDRSLSPVAPGAVGELCVGGAGVARGYLGRPALTAERFVPHPFADRPGARLYRSGDLARWRSRGGSAMMELDYLGRFDQQVKVRGFRIELGEVESVLTDHPALSEAAVVVREDIPGDSRLVAYAVPMPGERPVPAELRREAARRLPDYMVPTAVVLLDELPLTVNGKLDRRALPAPETRQGPAARDYVAPASDTEREVAAAWRQILGVGRIGANDNFFDLGGSSVLLMQVYEELRRRFENPPRLIELLQRPTVRELALRLDESGAQKPETPVADMGEGRDEQQERTQGRQRLLTQRRRRGAGMEGKGR